MLIIIGQIEASEGIALDKWLALIKMHGALASVPPRKGINPFTRQPCEYKAPTSTAIIRKGSTDIGLIYWAMNGSPLLIVEAEWDACDIVASIVEDIARSLAGRFERESYEK